MAGLSSAIIPAACFGRKLLGGLGAFRHGPERVLNVNRGPASGSRQQVLDGRWQGDVCETRGGGNRWARVGGGGSAQSAELSHVWGPGGEGGCGRAQWSDLRS